MLAKSLAQLNKSTSVQARTISFIRDKGYFVPEGSESESMLDMI